MIVIITMMLTTATATATPVMMMMMVIATTTTTKTMPLTWEVVHVYFLFVNLFIDSIQSADSNANSYQNTLSWGQRETRAAQSGTVV